MSTETVCPSCGQTVSNDVKFCRFCGAAMQFAEAPTEMFEPVEAGVATGQGQEDSANTSVAHAEPLDEAASPQFGTCAVCGAPQTRQDQQFCGSCGSPLSGTPSAAPAQPDVAATPAAAAFQPAASEGFADTASRRFRQLNSSLDDFMGASVDPNSAGSGFDASQVVLEGLGEQELAQAFGFFDKHYRAASQPGFEGDTGATMRETLEVGEGDADYMSEGDYLARSDDGDTHVSYEMFAVGMSDELVPTVGMLSESVKDAAASNETKERLKNMVAMGEISQEEAVDKAES